MNEQDVIELLKYLKIELKAGAHYSSLLEVKLYYHDPLSGNPPIEITSDYVHLSELKDEE